MNNIDGAVLFCCGDSRNGGLQKAIKKHFGWQSNCRIKLIALPGGPHLDVSTRFIRKQVKTYTQALKRKNATKVVVVIAEHDDCGYVAMEGRCNLKRRWLNKNFTQKVFSEIPAVKGIYLMNTGYYDCDKPVVASIELKLTELGSVVRSTEAAKMAA